MKIKFDTNSAIEESDTVINVSDGIDYDLDTETFTGGLKVPVYVLKNIQPVLKAMLVFSNGEGKSRKSLKSLTFEVDMTDSSGNPVKLRISRVPGLKFVDIENSKGLKLQLSSGTLIRLTNLV
jgi:hypothetical protein